MRIWTVKCFRSELPYNYTKGSDTLVSRLRIAGMYPAFIYLSIFFIFTSLFYFILFFFLLECLWSAKMLMIKGQLAFTKPHLLGQFIFHQEPVLILDHD